jgi:hypothetical protein
MEDLIVNVPFVDLEEINIIDLLSEDPVEEPILSDSDSDDESESESPSFENSSSDSDIEEVIEEEVRPLDEDPNILTLYTTEDPLCIVFRPERMIGRPEAIVQRTMRHIRRIYLQLEAE